MSNNKNLVKRGNNSQVKVAKVISRSSKGGGLVKRRRTNGGKLVKRRKTTALSVNQKYKTISIGGEEFNIDSDTLIRMIKQITQGIGEYKRMNNCYSRYIVSSLRKSRSDMISDLEHHFHIKWEIDSETGKSVFFR